MSKENRQQKPHDELEVLRYAWGDKVDLLQRYIQRQIADVKRDVKPWVSGVTIGLAVLNVFVIVVGLVIAVLIVRQFSQEQTERDHLQKRLAALEAEQTRIASAPILTPSPVASPRRTPLTPSITEYPAPTTATPKAAVWQFQGYVYQSNSKQGIAGSTIYLYEDCAAKQPLAQAQAESNGSFIVKYTPAKPPPLKFCLRAVGAPPWNNPLPSWKIPGWKEPAPGAVESSPLASPDKVPERIIFFFNIKRTFTGKVLDDAGIGVNGFTVELKSRGEETGEWSLLQTVTDTLKSGGVFTLTHETTAAREYYQIRLTSPQGYYRSGKPPGLATPQEWKATSESDPNLAVQLVETTKAVEGNDFHNVVTFFVRPRWDELAKDCYPMKKDLKLYAQATGEDIIATIEPNSFFKCVVSLLSEQGRVRVKILVGASSPKISQGDHLVSPFSPPEEHKDKRKTIGQARRDVGIEDFKEQRGWIEGYLPEDFEKP